MGTKPKQLTCDDILKYIRDELYARGDPLLSTFEVSLRPLKDRFRPGPAQARVTAAIRACVQGGFIRRTTGGGPGIWVELTPAGVQRLEELNAPRWVQSLQTALRSERIRAGRIWAAVVILVTLVLAALGLLR